MVQNKITIITWLLIYINLKNLHYILRSLKFPPFNLDLWFTEKLEILREY